MIDKANYARCAKERAKHKLFENVITLDQWKFSTSPDSATDLSISVTINESGRFAAGVTGKNNEEGDFGKWYFQSENVEQRMVAKGEHFNFNIPLKRYNSGVPRNIAITLYLFSDSTGSAGRDVIKIFQSVPEIESYNDQYFYGVLPNPTELLK